MGTYTIYSHLLSSYEKKNLNSQEKERAKKLFLLFLLSDTLLLDAYIDKLDLYEFDNLETSFKLYLFRKHTESVFSIPTDDLSFSFPGLLNKLFFYSEMLSKLENIQEHTQLYFSLFKELKDKADEIKLDLFIMEKRLEPYDKKEPDFSLKPFLQKVKAIHKKLLMTSFYLIKKYLKDETVLLFIHQNIKNLSKIYGKKKVGDLIKIVYPKGKNQIDKHLHTQYKKRGFVEFMQNQTKNDAV